jgi:hypothetical protein
MKGGSIEEDDVKLSERWLMYGNFVNFEGASLKRISSGWATIFFDKA